MSFWDYVRNKAQKTKNFVNRANPQVGNFNWNKQVMNPVNSFVSKKVNQNITQPTRNFVNSSPKLNWVDNASNFIKSDKKVAAPVWDIGNAPLNRKIVPGAYNLIARPFINGALDISLNSGLDIGRTLVDPSQQYNQLKSPITKLAWQGANKINPNAMRGMGVNSSRGEVLGNTGQIIMDIADVYMPGAGKKVLAPLIKRDLATYGYKQLLKRAIKTGVIQGGKEGAKVGGAYAFGEGLNENRNENLDNQLGNAMQAGIIGGAGGAIVGGAIGGLTPVVTRGGKVVYKTVKGGIKAYQAASPAERQAGFAKIPGKDALSNEAKPVTLYHGTTVDNVTNLKPSTTTGTRGENQLPGIYTSDNYDTARYFASKNGVQSFEPIKSTFKGNTLEIQNIKALQDKMGTTDLNKIAENLKKQGYDAVKFAEKANGLDGSEYVILNPEKINKPLSTTPKTEVRVDLEIKKVADNLQKNNVGLARLEAEAMAKDVIENRKFSPTTAGTSDLSEKALPKVAQKGRIEPPQVEQTTIKPPVESPNPQSVGGQGGHIANQKSSSFDDNIPDNDLISQLTKSLKEAKPLRGKQEALYTKARAQKFAKMMSARDKMAGEKGLQAELGALKGELPKVEYEAVRNQFNQQSVDRLFNIIKKSNKIDEWDKINAQVGLSKLLGEQGMGVPTVGEIEKLHKVFGKEFTEAIMSKRPVFEKLKDAGMQMYNLPRSMMAGIGDFSATLMQNALFAYRHPVTTAKNFAASVKMFGSDDFYKASMEEIANRPNKDLYRQSKLALTDVSPIMSKREEEFMSSWAEKIPGIGRVIKASGRAYTGFLNKMRADVADQLINTKKLLGEDVNDPRFLESMGNFVNAATGRGNLGSLEKSGNVLAQGLFSARKLVATFQTLNPRFYITADPLIRKEALKTMGAFFGGAATITGMAKLAGADVSTDPTSADFGKIKVGNTRVNMFGTYQQLAVLTARLFKGYATSSTTGNKMTLGDEDNPYSPTRLDLALRFFESKEHPTLSLITGAMKGQNQIGDDFDLSTETLRRFLPMIVADSYDLYKEHGAVGLLGVIPTMLGLPTQTYGSQVPNIETTKSGKPTIKLSNTPDVAQTITNFFRGKPESNIPKDQWGGIIEQKKTENKVRQEKESLKQGGGNTTTLSSDGIMNFSDGSAGYMKDGELKTYDTREEAELEVQKDKFDKSGKRFLIDQKTRTVFTKDSRGKVKDQSIEEYYEPIIKSEFSRLVDEYKRNDDINSYLQLNDSYTQYLQQRLNTLDPDADRAEIIKLQNTIADNKYYGSKYASQGGFKKAKKPKRLKAPKAPSVSVARTKSPKIKTIKAKKPAKIKIKSL